MEFFNNPTVAYVTGRCVAAAAAATSQAPDVVLGPRHESDFPDGLLPLSAAQRRMYFLNQLDPSSSSYNVPAVYTLRVRVAPVFLCACV